MGVLDDAIRDHLDLKRRHGADPAEVERAEREALGPVRREPEPLAESESMADELPYEHDDEPPWEETHEPVAAAPELDREPPQEPEQEPRSGRDDDPFDEPRTVQRLAFAEPDEAEQEPETLAAARPAEPTPRPVAAPPAAEHGGGETVEYDVEHAMESGDDKGEDMLEETPEFLQDTPDHDRLWFEQKPPKDFDFEG